MVGRRLVWDPLPAVAGSYPARGQVLMRLMHGLRRAQRGARPAEHIDAAAVIARSLNRVPVTDEMAGAPEIVTFESVVLEPELELEPGPVIVRIPLRTRRGADPLVDELVSLGMSLIYDLTSSGPRPWDAIVVELPPAEEPVIQTYGTAMSGPLPPSMHSRGTLDVIRAQLDDVDPGCGYDIVIRRAEVALCRWPSRASDVRDP